MIRATTSSILTAANQAIEAEQQTNNRESRRGSRRHLPSDLIRQLKNDYDDDELEDEEGLSILLGSFKSQAYSLNSPIPKRNRYRRGRNLSKSIARTKKHKYSTARKRSL